MKKSRSKISFFYFSTLSEYIYANTLDRGEQVHVELKWSHYPQKRRASPQKRRADRSYEGWDRPVEANSKCSK